MDNDDILYGIKPWSHGAYHGCSSSQNILNITRTLHRSLMNVLDLKPLLAARTVSVEGPIRVDNVDHHVRATSEMIIPIQTVIEDAKEKEPSPNKGYLEKRLKTCGHCRNLRQDGEFEEGIAGESELEEEDCEDDEYGEEEDQEAEEECDEDDEEDCEDEDEEEDEEEEDEYCISIMDCTPRKRPCRDPPQVKTQPNCPKRTQTHFRELKQPEQKDDKENGKECNDKEGEESKEKKDNKKKCHQENSGFDELHQECVHLSKDELEKICKKYKLYGMQSCANKDKTQIRDVDKGDDCKPEKQKNGQSKCEQNEEDNNEEDEKQEETCKNAKSRCEDESYEKSDEDDEDYFGLERPCKAAPWFIEKPRENIECPEETIERDYSRYDDNIPEDDNEDIFFQINPNYSPIKRGSCERKNNKASPRDDKKNKKNSNIAPKKCELSPISSPKALKRNGDDYCDGNSVKGLIRKKRDNKIVKVNRNGAKIEKDADVSSYFEDECSDPNEERKAVKTPKKGVKANYYTHNSNNNNPNGVTDELGDYYEHDDEGNNATEAVVRGCVDIRGRGDYTGYCFGKDGGKVYEDADKYDSMKAMENNKYTYKEYNSDTGSENERYNEVIEPGCTSALTVEDCSTSTIKNQLKYQKYGHSSDDTSDDNYFTPSSLVSCESLGRDMSHELVAQGSPAIEMVLKNANPNYFSVDTGETTQQIGAYDSDTGFSLTTINFEHYKRVFESIKQRAFAEECEEYFEPCSPDPIEETSEQNAFYPENPQVLSGTSETDSNGNKMSAAKQGGFLKNILGIITKSRAKKVQKVGSTDFLANEINVSEIGTEKMKFSERKYFSFGRYKVKNGDKSFTINDLISIKKKQERKPKLKVGKTFKQPAGDTSLVSAVGAIVEDVGNSPVQSAVGKIRKVNKLEKRHPSEDEIVIKEIGYNYNSGRSSTSTNDGNNSQEMDDVNYSKTSAVLKAARRGAKKSSGERKSSIKRLIDNQEMDDLTEEQLNVDDIRRGVIFTAKLEEASLEDLEISGLRLLNSIHGPSQMKLMDEGEKGTLVCSFSELANSIDIPLIDVHPHSPSIDDDISSSGIINTVADTHGNTSQALVPMDENTIENILSDIFTVQDGITKERKRTKLNPFNKAFMKNTPKAQDVLNDSKLQTHENEGQKLVKTGREKPAMARTADELTNALRSPMVNLGKTLSSSAGVAKALDDNSTISENSTSLPQCLTEPSTVEHGPTSQNLILSSFTRSDKKNKHNASYAVKCLVREVSDNKASTENIDKHECQLIVPKLGGKNKSANLEPKAPIKSPLLNNAVIKEDSEKSERKRNQFFKVVKSGPCEKPSSGKTLKKWKLGSISSKQNLNQEPEITKNTFKCKSPIQIKALGKGKTLRNVCRKKSTGQINLGAYDNDNQNANCDDDDLEDCKPQNLSNVIFPDMQQPLQNICDMVELAGMSEAQAMAGHDETSSKLVMESFMLDGAIESEITSNLVSYEHPSFRSGAVCCLDDVHEHISPQSDLLIQNPQYDMSRNDSCLIISSEMDSKMTRFDSSSKIQDMQLKNFTRNELGLVQDKIVSIKLEDPKVGVIKYGLDKGEALIQSQHVETATKLQDSVKGFREKKEVSPATEKLGQREERIASGFWKYASYETGETASSDKNETVNLGRYAKYNNIDNNNDIFGDGQKQSYTNFGSLLPASDRTGISQGVQIFFGGSYTPSMLQPQKASEDERYRTGGYGSNMKMKNRELSSEAVYTTARHDVVEAKEIPKSDYLESKSPLHHMNFGASWVPKEGQTLTEFAKSGTNYTDGNAMKPHPKLTEGHSIKLNADYFELKVGASKDAGPKAGTAYSPAWRISDANKCKTEEATDTQFWSRNFNSPLSTDERIGKMADAILDMKPGRSPQDTDCWSDRIYSPASGAGVAWKRDDSVAETKSAESNPKAGWNAPPTHSPERRGDKAWTVHETDVQENTESQGWSLPMHRPVEPNEWNLDGLAKRATEIQNNESLVYSSRNDDKIAHIITHGVDAAVRNEAFEKKSHLISSKSPSSSLRSPKNDGKEYAKGNAGWRDGIGNAAKVKDKQKETVTDRHSAGKSRFDREEPVSDRSDRRYPNKTISDNNRRDKGESDAGRKANGITSPNVSSRFDAGNRYGYSINSGQSKEGMARKDKMDSPNQGQKLGSPTNHHSDAAGRYGQGSNANTGRNVHEEAFKHPFTGKPRSGNERIIIHAKREERDAGTRKDEVTKDMKFSIKMGNKGDSSNRHGFTVFSNAAQSGGGSSPEQLGNKKHKSLYEDISSARSRTESSPSKEIKKSGSGSRIGYTSTSSAGKYSVDTNSERQNTSGKESRRKIEKPFSKGLSLDSPRSGETGARQGYRTSPNMGKNTGDVRGDQVRTDGHWKENGRTRDFTESGSPRRSTKPDSGGYVMRSPGGRTKVSPNDQEPYLTKDSISRRDKGNVASGRQDTTSPRNDVPMSRIEHGTNHFNAKRSQQQTAFINQDNSSRRDNIAGERRKSSSTINGNKEPTWNSDNSSKTGKNNAQKSPSSKDSSSKRGKIAGGAANNETETKVNASNELKSKRGYSANSDKRKDHAYLVELSRIGKEKLAASQRRDAGVLSVNESKKKAADTTPTALTAEGTKQGSSKKDKSARDGSATRSINTSPSAAPKGESKSKPSVAKKHKDQTLEQPSGTKESYNRFEKKLDDTMSLPIELKSPRVKTEARNRQSYLSPDSDKNKFNHDAVQRSIVRDVSGNRADKRADDRRHVAGTISHSLSANSEFRSNQTSLKSPTSSRTNQSYLTVESSGRNPKEGRGVIGNGRETSPILNTRLEQSDRHRNVRRTNEHSNATHEKDRTDKRPSEDWNRRRGADSKAHMKSEDNGRSTPNSGKNSPYHKVDRSGKENGNKLENSVDDALRYIQEMSPKLYTKNEKLNGRHGFYDGSGKGKGITSHRGEQSAGETHSWSEKAAVSPSKESPALRGQLNNEFRKGQGGETSPSGSKNTLYHWAPCITVESVAPVETMEETIGQSNQLSCLNAGGIRGNDEDGFPAGLSMPEQLNMEQQQTPRDATDYTGGEMALKANELVHLNSDQSLHQDLADSQCDYTVEELPGHIETELASFEMSLGDPATGTKEGFDWRSRPPNSEMNMPNIKPVQGYIKHQGASRSKQPYPKTNETNYSAQSDAGKVDTIMQNTQIIGDYSVVKSDHSPKTASLIENSIDLARHENRLTDMGVMMNNAANLDASSYMQRGDKTGQKIEKRGEIDGQQTDFEKRDGDKFGPTSNRQSGAKASIGSNGGSDSSKRSDQLAQLKGINDWRAMESLGSTDDKRADSHQNHKAAQKFRADFEDKGRNKASDNSRRQRTNEQGTTDAQSPRAQLERKLQSQLSGDSEERKQAALERFMIRRKLKKSDSKLACYPSRRVENSKSEVYPTLDTSEKTQSIEQYQQLSSADSKSVGKKWKTEIHRKRFRSEADKISDGEKCDLSSSVDAGWKNTIVASKYSLHSSDGRRGAELKKKHQESLGWTAKSGDISPENNSRNDGISTRQGQPMKTGGNGSLLKNSSWRSEQYEASKKTVARNEATQSASGEKAKRRPITVKKSQTDTNQTERYSSTMIDSSLVDNVARAWMEDTEKMNVFRLKDNKGSNPPMARQTSGTASSTYQSGINSGKDLRESPAGNGGDYLDVFLRPTFLNNSKSRKHEEPDHSPVRLVQKAPNLHFANKQFDEDLFQDGEFTGNKLVTLDRESRRDGIHISLNPNKQFYSKFEQFVPQTVSLDSRPYLAHLVNNKPRNIRKQLTKDDSFIYQTNGYIDNVGEVDKHAVRNNRLDGVTSEKSYSIRDKRRKEVALHGVPEDRAPTKITQDGPQRGNSQQVQRTVDNKNGKTASENAQATKPKPDNTKDIKITPKNTKINKKHEASYGTKTTSEHSKNNKAAEDASHGRPTQDSARGSKQAESSGDKKANPDTQPPRGQMFSYKVSSKGSGSEVVKSTQRATQSAVKAEKADPATMKQNLQAGLVTETTPDLLRDPISEIKDETKRREPVPEPAQLGLFARLINTLTRSSKVTTQVTDSVPSSESKQEISNKPTECVSEQVKPDSAKEKVGLSKRNRPIYNRSPAMSLRDGKNMRPDYRQNMNGNAHCDMDGEPSPEAFERRGVVIQQWSARRKKPYCRVNKTNVPGKNHTNSVAFAVEPGEKHTSFVAFETEPGKKHTSYDASVVVPGKNHTRFVASVVVPGKNHTSFVASAVEPGKKHTSFVASAVVPGKNHTSFVASAVEPGKKHTSHVASDIEPGKKHTSYDTSAVEPGKKHTSYDASAVEPGKKNTSFDASDVEPGKKNTSFDASDVEPGKKHTSFVAYAVEPGKKNTSFVASEVEATTLKAVLMVTLCIGACYPVVWKCCSEFPLPSIHELIYIHCLFSLGIDALLRKNQATQ